MQTRRIVIALLAALVLLPPVLAHNGHEPLSNRGINGGAAACDTRGPIPTAGTQASQQPFNYSTVYAAHGRLWINATATLLGDPGDSCVFTVSFNGARYGTALGTGSGTTTPVLATGTCVANAFGPSCATGIELDWTINFLPTIYLWADYTLCATALDAATGLSTTSCSSGTAWLYEPSVPWDDLGLEEPRL